MTFPGSLCPWFVWFLVMMMIGTWTLPFLVFIRYQNFKYLHFKMFDDNNKSLPVTNWTTIVRKKANTKRFSLFVNTFLPATHSMLYGHLPPRMFPEFRKIIHLRDSEVVRDWYIFQQYTVIRLYGCELKPFWLLVYLNERMLTLEFIRQALNVDSIHLASSGRKLVHKFPFDVCPFVVKSRDAFEWVDKFVSSLSLHNPLVIFILPFD